jgi:hypothetical protein
MGGAALAIFADLDRIKHKKIRVLVSGVQKPPIREDD